MREFQLQHVCAHGTGLVGGALKLRLSSCSTWPDDSHKHSVTGRDSMWGGVSKDTAKAKD